MNTRSTGTSLLDAQSRVGRSAGHLNQYGARMVMPSIVLVLALFPYVTFGPLGLPTEVQPWAALTAWISILILLVRSRLYLERFHWIMLTFSLLFLAYVPLNETIEIGQYLRKSMSFLLSVSILVIARYLSPKKTLSILKISALVWLLFGLLGTFFPSEYLLIAREIVPGALGAYGERGVTSLAPEATDYGFTMVYLWVIAQLASNAEQARDRRGAPIWLFAVILVNIVLSRSAVGLFSLAILQSIYWMTFSSKLQKNSISANTFFWGGILAVLFLLLAALLPETGIRGIDLLMQGIRDPHQLVDTTLSYRLAHNLVGLYGLVDSSFMGWGAGSFVVQGINVYTENNIEGLLNVQHWYAYNIPLTLQVSPLAIFPVIIFEYGIWGVIFIFYIFSSVLKSNVTAKYVLAFLLFLTWAQSFPSAYPLFWLLLGLIYNAGFSLAPQQPRLRATAGTLKEHSRKW